MTEREIAYSRCAVTVGACPCCGALCTSGEVYACTLCYLAHGPAMVKARLPQFTAARDWFYDLGVRLRAEGKMPALKAAPPADEGQLYGVWLESEVPGTTPWCHVASGRLCGSIEEANASREFLTSLHPAYTYEVRPYPKPAESMALCPTCGRAAHSGKCQESAEPKPVFSKVSVQWCVPGAHSSRFAICARCKQQTFDSMREECTAPGCEPDDDDPIVFTRNPIVRTRLYPLAVIARALAETDLALVAVVDRVSDADPARRERAIAVAIGRDEAGAVTRAKEAVERIVKRLERRP
jgi:hypothetical protein